MQFSTQHNILVTGGAGFIGSHLVDELLSQGYSVRVLDNLRNGSLLNLEDACRRSEFEFLKGDILNTDDCTGALKGVDIVYHLACLGVRHSLHSPVENHEVNASGTLNVLEAARYHKTPKFFYISTSEVYGSTNSFPIEESAATIPNTVYGASKLVGEHYSAAYHKRFGLDTTVLRIFNNYGPRAHYEGDAGEVIPRTIVNALYDIRPVLFGEGGITRDFFYVKDTAKALSMLVNTRGLTGATINIGTGTEYSIKHVIEKVLELMNKKALGIKYLEERPADVPRLWVNADKFYKLTNFVSKYTFEQGLTETIGYYTQLANSNNLVLKVIEKNWEQ